MTLFFYKMTEKEKKTRPNRLYHDGKRIFYLKKVPGTKNKYKRVYIHNPDKLSKKAIQGINIYVNTGEKGSKSKSKSKKNQGSTRGGPKYPQGRLGNQYQRIQGQQFGLPAQRPAQELPVYKDIPFKALPGAPAEKMEDIVYDRDLAKLEKKERLRVAKEAAAEKKKLEAEVKKERAARLKEAKQYEKELKARQKQEAKDAEMEIDTDPVEATDATSRRKTKTKKLEKEQAQRQVEQSGPMDVDHKPKAKETIADKKRRAAELKKLEKEQAQRQAEQSGPMDVEKPEVRRRMRAPRLPGTAPIGNWDFVPTIIPTPNNQPKIHNIKNEDYGGLFNGTNHPDIVNGPEEKPTRKRKNSDATEPETKRKPDEVFDPTKATKEQAIVPYVPKLKKRDSMQVPHVPNTGIKRRGSDAGAPESKRKPDEVFDPTKGSTAIVPYAQKPKRRESIPRNVRPEPITIDMNETGRKRLLDDLNRDQKRRKTTQLMIKDRETGEEKKNLKRERAPSATSTDLVPYVAETKHKKAKTETEKKAKREEAKQHMYASQEADRQESRAERIRLKKLDEERLAAVAAEEGRKLKERRKSVQAKVLTELQAEHAKRERKRDETTAKNTPLPDDLEGGGVEEDGMSDVELMRMARKTLRKTIPVLAKDETQDLLRYAKPKNKMFGAILNLSARDAAPSSKDPEHWVSVFVDNTDPEGGSIEYYDPLCLKPPSRDVVQTLRKIAARMNPGKYMKLKVNALRRQDPDSSTCGLHALQFLRDRYDDKSFSEASGYDEYLARTKPDDYQDGESDIRRLYRSYL
jgi:hypothetical protein